MGGAETGLGVPVIGVSGPSGALLPCFGVPVGVGRRLGLFGAFLRFIEWGSH
jgi:hypothetical protein